MYRPGQRCSRYVGDHSSCLGYVDVRSWPHTSPVFRDRGRDVQRNSARASGDCLSSAVAANARCRVSRNEPFRSVMLLCDFAQEVGGKLYIVGGGWSKVFDIGQPMNMALAIKLWVPWNAANQPTQLAIELRTED